MQTNAERSMGIHWYHSVSTMMDALPLARVANFLSKVTKALQWFDRVR